MKAELRANTSTSIPLFRNPQNSLSGTLKGCLCSLDGACIEKLLIHCANALESNDGTLAQQVMWVLNNVASLVGDPNQRLTSYFLNALISRAAKICPTPANFDGSSRTIQRRPMSVIELAGYVDLIPWHRFGFCASNNAIFKAIEGYSKVHILDFSTTYGMQWPTLIDTLAKRPEGSPSLRITVPSFRPPVPPLLNIPTGEVGLRLTNFSKIKEVPFEFKVIGEEIPCKESSSFDDFEALLAHLTCSSLNLCDDEALVINCQNWLRYLNDEHDGRTDDFSSLRDAFLLTIKELNPCIVVVVDEDCDLSERDLTTRITTCFNYLWIPFDALETFLPKDSEQRMEYECDVGQKIENIITFEGLQRIERLESGIKLSKRMEKNGFISVPYCEESMREVKYLLDEHASGWGMKRQEDMLVLTWKGHNSVFATAWVPHNGCLED